MAEYLGTTKASVSRWETGERSAPIDKQLRLKLDRWVYRTRMLSQRGGGLLLR